MLVVKVNRRNPQAAQTLLAACAEVLGAPAYAPLVGIVCIAHDPEFRRDDYLASPLLNRSSDELFVAAHAVDVRSVEQCDAAIDGTMNRGEGFLLARIAIKLGHAHAAEAQRGHHERTFAQSSIFHWSTPGRYS